MRIINEYENRVLTKYGYELKFFGDFSEWSKENTEKYWTIFFAHIHEIILEFFMTAKNTMK
jgi:hypothetical protein